MEFVGVCRYGYDLLQRLAIFGADNFVAEPVERRYRCWRRVLVDCECLAIQGNGAGSCRWIRVLSYEKAERAISRPEAPCDELYPGRAADSLINTIGGRQDPRRPIGTSRDHTE